MAPKYYRNVPPSPRESVNDRTLSPPRSSSPSPIPLPNKQEREGYYLGLPSGAPLVARSSTAIWEPLDSDGHLKEKELGSVGHDNFGGDEQRGLIISEILDILKTHSVRWTSIDFVRIGYEEEYPKPAIVWIGVRPGALTNEDGLSLPVAGKVVFACMQVLEKYDVLDVECEIRESIVWPDYSGLEEPAETSKSK